MEDDNLTPTAVITLPKPATFDVIRLRDQTRLGHRVDSFNIDAVSYTHLDVYKRQPAGFMLRASAIWRPVSPAINMPSPAGPQNAKACLLYTSL